MGIERNLTGEQHGRITVIKHFDRTKKGKNRWLCECACGVQFIKNTQRILNGAKSCGCYKSDKLREYLTTVAADYPKEHAVWKTMRQRCNNKNATDYDYYGGRGIKVCKEWDFPKGGFTNFIRDMGPRPTNYHTIDRKDNNGNYCPDNCKWATRKEQNINTRQVKWITHNGKTRCIADWLSIIDISKCTFYSRVRKGWSMEKAMFTPPDACKQIGGKTKTKINHRKNQ